jgi:hypothetical protein
METRPIRNKIGTYLLIVTWHPLRDVPPFAVCEAVFDTSLFRFLATMALCFSQHGHLIMSFLATANKVNSGVIDPR